MVPEDRHQLNSVLLLLESYLPVVYSKYLRTYTVIAIIIAIAEEIPPMNFSLEGYPTSYALMSHGANTVLEHAK